MSAEIAKIGGGGNSSTEATYLTQVVRGVATPQGATAPPPICPWGVAVRQALRWLP